MEFVVSKTLSELMCSFYFSCY